MFLMLQPTVAQCSEVKCDKVVYVSVKIKHIHENLPENAISIKISNLSVKVKEVRRSTAVK